MTLKELLSLIEPCEMLMVKCIETNTIGNKVFFLTCLDSRDLLSRVTSIYTNEYGYIVIAIDLHRFRG